MQWNDQMTIYTIYLWSCTILFQSIYYHLNIITLEILFLHPHILLKEFHSNLWQARAGVSSVTRPFNWLDVWDKAPLESVCDVLVGNIIPSHLNNKSPFKISINYPLSQLILEWSHKLSHCESYPFSSCY